MTDTVTTIEGDVIDAIAFRHYGRHGGTAEAVIEANPGLADQPALLPAGLVIVLPVLPAAGGPTRGVRLYD